MIWRSYTRQNLQSYHFICWETETLILHWMISERLLGRKNSLLRNFVTRSVITLFEDWTNWGFSCSILRCDHEQTDARKLIDIDQEINFDGFQNIILASPNTDFLVSPFCHYYQWVYINLKELWTLCVKRANLKQQVH